MATKTTKTKKTRSKKDEDVKTTKKTAKTKASEKKASKATKATKAKASAKKGSTKKGKAAKPDTSHLPKPMKEKLTKTQLIQHLADETELDKKDVKKVMEALETTMIASIRKKGLGEFMIPGLLKVVTKHIPAKKGGETKMSFGKEIVTKPKPATTKIKVRPMKKLKDAALV